MAATDQTYRNQKTLDYIFAASCILMLVGTIWMFVQDYFREFKVIQRNFRDVEEAMAQREVLNLAPGSDKIKAIVEAEKAVADARANLDKVKAENSAEVNRILPEQLRASNEYAFIKADYDSIVSFYDIAVANLNAATEGPHRERLKRERDRLGDQVKQLKARLDQAKDILDQKTEALNKALLPQQQAEAALAKAEDRLKSLTADFDRFAKLAEQKRWGMGDRLRSLPILDAFASPIRIQQTFHDDLPINYNFKYVTRYDRCGTCHLGIDRPAYTQQALQALGQPPSEQLQKKLEDARNALQKRQEIIKGAGGISPGDLQLRPIALTPAQVRQYAVHPRLDLFVDANSPHPSEKFGCTICHAGQGSATDFYNASHTPNDAVQMEKWKQDHHWHASHYWDFPMQPSRFLQSSCVKCHYEMTDLIRDGSRIEAPKLLRGYNLVRENGCFGCHEIAGIAGGRRVGPDLRVEPSPPLEAYTPAERAKLTADPLNPPGTMRKVGPSLRRLSEKTNYEWLIHWLRAPRDFRPDTKMPHFYGLSNNHPDVLPADQKYFPDAEIHAIAYFLITESSNYLQGNDKYRLASQARLKELQQLADTKEISDSQKRELDEIKRQLELAGTPAPLPELPAKLMTKATPEQIYNGRKLFSERGCLACHQHEGTEKAPAKGPAGKPDLPTITGDAQFAPNLSRLAAKLGTKTGDEASARRWLVQWIMNPSFHHPRTRMPVTHLTLEEANDVASWLLSVKVADDWVKEKVPEPSLQNLKDLAKVFLSRVYTRREVEDYLKAGVPKKRLDEDNKPLNADERELELVDGDAKSLEHKLKRYIGRKAIGQLGCYGCHDIPGFETAKPIGTPLNDWGKKDPERLAFEDAIAYVRRTYHVVDKLTDDKGKPVASEGGKPLYEKYFYDLLDHHKREGFLHQKLTEPRSYDYDRIRAWDDRLRMPQFRFARAEPKAGESPEEFRRRAEVEEAEAREAVMTFILGLVAEPIPPKYVNNPPPDRLAEVKGRQVLDKYNCAGCHLIRPGVYQFKLTEEATKNLEDAYNLARGTFAADHIFPDHNAWVGPAPMRAGQLTAFGLGSQETDPDDPTKIVRTVRLTQALRFDTREDGKVQSRDLPAYSYLVLPKDMLTQADPYGGTFGDLLVNYLSRLDKQRYDKEDKTRPAVPPALLRQGEKTQPLWLFNFLRNPHEIRPVTVLRMPRFNMSEEEAMALVNYFAAVDKIHNPATGVTYPYLTFPEREEGYLAAQTMAYVERLKKTTLPGHKATLFEERLQELKPIWEETLRSSKAQLAQAQAQLKEVEDKVKEAQEAEKKEEDKAKKKQLEEARQKLEQARDQLKKEVDRLRGEVEKNDLKTQQERWEKRDAYAIDGFKLLISEQVCLNCHQVGHFQAKERQGPPLDLSWQRLRSDWTRRWLANPQRFLTYTTPMPQNFPRNTHQFRELFEGTSLEQLTAARDALMNYPSLIDQPAIRSRPVVVAGGGP